MQEILYHYTSHKSFIGKMKLKVGIITKPIATRKADYFNLVSYSMFHYPIQILYPMYEDFGGVGLKSCFAKYKHPYSHFAFLCILQMKPHTRYARHQNRDIKLCPWHEDEYCTNVEFLVDHNTPLLCRKVCIRRFAMIQEDGTRQCLLVLARTS